MFEGVYTALVTPFDRDGAVDYEVFRRLIERQVEGGVDGIVPVGTTGESPTLSVDEHKKVIETSIEAAGGRVKVIAGTGGNSTREALELTQHAKDAGANGTLQVTPYYNKPSQEGLFQHFTQVADLGLPVVLYNIPARTSKAIDLDTVIKLADHESIVAIKEATGNIDLVSLYRRHCDIEVLSGDDALTLPLMSVGGVGVISVTSNVHPEAMTGMVHSALEGDWNGARRNHAHFHRLFTDLFVDVNPIPVKSAMAMMGLMEETYRLPLCAMSEANKATLRETLTHYGWIES